MIGYYDYTVIATYLSVLSSLVGMTLLTRPSLIRFSVICLMFSGLCDMFDGKIARSKKNRTEQEKKFGIQLDSLADVVCFGAFPALLNYSLSGGTHKIGFITSAIYLICGIIRLAYFNVMEEERQSQTTENRKYYQGMPITSISVIFPTVYLLKYLLHIQSNWGLIFNITTLITAILFVLNFKFRKPTNRELAILTIFGFIILIAIIQLGVFHK